MKILSNKIHLVLFGGDLVSFVFSLWFTLFLRYGEVPTDDVFYEHMIPFSFLFLIWIFVFFIAGLYEGWSVILSGNLARILVKVQLINTLIAIVFFYFIPSFGITPKTNLFVYIFVSSAIIFWWRFHGYFLIGAKKREDALLVGSGIDAYELKKEVDSSDHYAVRFITYIDVDAFDTEDGYREEIGKNVYANETSIIVAELRNPKVKKIFQTFYNLIFSGVRFLDMYEIYEEIFNRVPLSHISESWFIENISTIPKTVYDTLKRAMDIVIASVLGVISLALYPFVAIAIKLEDGGDIFITQKRIGWNNKIIKMFKFRSMKTNDGGKWVSNGDKRITKVGGFLRRSRIDELPQLWNIIKGDMSLIGPRPDIYDLGLELSREIPYYTIRNIIKPGLSGWAQIQQKTPPQTLEDTKIRLAYDFYYIKNRSLFLDVKIALKTIKTLLSRLGV